MAREEKVWKFAEEAGYEPLENRCIIVKYAPANLSDQIASFINGEFYVLQLCKSEMILLPFDPMWTGLRKDVSLVLPYGEIQSVEVSDDLLNSVIAIRTGEDLIRLTAQQKELSDLRTSGLYCGGKNWHKENLEGTLLELKKLGSVQK